MPGVAEVRTPWTGVEAGEPADPRAVSRDGSAVALTVAFDASPAGWDAVEPATEVVRGIDAPRVLVGGEDLLDEDMNAQAGEDLARAEMLSMPVVLVLLLILFGGLVAAGLPIIIATVGVAATMAALLAAATFTDVSVYAVNIITMLGLGLAIDYALLIVSRFREERAVDPDVPGALARTYATAGRTVAFSGLTVAASLAGLLVFPDDFLRSMGLAGLTVVLLDMVAALTLLPALLSLVGHRVRPGRRSPGSGRVVAGLARALRGRTALAVVLIVAPLLAIAALPFLGARYADPDVRSLPRSTESRQVAEAVADRFATSADVERVTVVASRTYPGRAAGDVRRESRRAGRREVRRGARRRSGSDRDRPRAARAEPGADRDAAGGRGAVVAGARAGAGDRRRGRAVRLPGRAGVTAAVGAWASWCSRRSCCCSSSPGRS